MNIKQVFGTSLLALISIGLFVGFKQNKTQGWEYAEYKVVRWCSSGSKKPLPLYLLRENNYLPF